MAKLAEIEKRAAAATSATARQGSLSGPVPYNPLLPPVGSLGYEATGDVKPSAAKTLSIGKENILYLPSQPQVPKAKVLSDVGFTPYGYGDKALTDPKTTCVKLKRPLAEIQMNGQDPYVQYGEQASKITRVDQDWRPGGVPQIGSGTLDSTQGLSSTHLKGSQGTVPGPEPGPDFGIRGGVKCVRLVALDVLDDPHNRVKSIACFESNSSNSNSSGRSGSGSGKEKGGLPSGQGCQVEAHDG